MDTPIYVSPRFWTHRKIMGVALCTLLPAVAALCSFQVPQFQAAANARLNEITASLETTRLTIVTSSYVGTGLSDKTQQEAFNLLMEAKGLILLSNESLHPRTLTDRLAWAYADEETSLRALATIRDTVFAAECLSGDAQSILNTIRGREAQDRYSRRSGLKI